MSQDDGILTFPKGLAGFPGLHRFRLHEPSGSYPLRFLESLDDPGLSLNCMDAAAVKLDYEVPLGDEDAALLALERPEDALVLVTVVVPDNPSHMTANLAGPLVVNTRTCVGCQVELPVDRHPLQFPVFAPKDDVIIDFPKGLIGFPEYTSYRLFEPQGSYPIKFLQAVEAPEISFACLDVAAIQPDYAFPLGDEDADFLALERLRDALVLALVVIPEDPRQMTANLAGPVVINIPHCKGRQVALPTERYALKHPVFPDAR